MIPPSCSFSVRARSLRASVYARPRTEAGPGQLDVHADLDRLSAGCRAVVVAAAGHQQRRGGRQRDQCAPG
jgi:hypothetical protein